MGQVPHYLIIGDGRVATHYKYYFTLLKLSFESWCRKECEDKLIQALNKATHVLILISDRCIDNFIKQYTSPYNLILIHFSGSLLSQHAYGMHPLTTFNDNLYDLNTYKSIPFIVDQDAPDFEILLPGVSNPHWRLSKELKPKYHALCVLSGNFSCMLWQKLFKSLEQEFNLPSSIAHTFLSQVTDNLLSGSKNVLTGPLTRNDTETVQKNLLALHSDPFQAVYKSFLTCFEQQKIRERI